MDKNFLEDNMEDVVDLVLQDKGMVIEQEVGNLGNVQMNTNREKVVGYKQCMRKSKTVCANISQDRAVSYAKQRGRSQTPKVRAISYRFVPDINRWQAKALVAIQEGYKKTLDTSVISISLDNRVIDVAPLRSYIDHDEYLRDQGLNYDTSSFSSSFAIYENYMFCFFMVYSIVMFL
ncbi:hypothetical protein GOBAR_DD12355 [Gossypium barbadense]|nr:hypothetical protein GOBAR_DD12355 [Gossypium barbadense]